MPSYVVKVTPDEDLYVVWSTVEECPYAWGTREEITGYLLERSEKQPKYAKPEIDERFERADATGTSMFYGHYSWDAAGFIFQQKGLLPRSKLAAFLDSYSCEDGRDTYDETLLEPFEDDDE